jgi:hypothetical protein
MHRGGRTIGIKVKDLHITRAGSAPQVPSVWLLQMEGCGGVKCVDR